MSSDERGNSLADQAAAWVPPWARQPAEPQAAEPQSGEPEPGPEEPDEPAPAVADERAVADELSAGDEVPEQTAATETAGAPAAAPDEPVPAAVAASAPGPADVPVTGNRRRVPRRPEPRPAVDLPALDDDAELDAALEAILLVVDQPIGEMLLAQTLEQPVERIGAALERLSAGYTAAGHGFDLRRAAGGWRFYTRAEYAGYVERYILDGQTVRLTQAALETLAVVAYKQPVTRSRLAAVRGVNCDGVLRTLVVRGLVEECGTEPDSGAFLYRTTTMFLEKLGLNTLADLPPLAPFLPTDIEELTDAP